MRFNRLVLLVLFSLFAITAFAQPPMPDFSKWNKVEDHTTPYLSKGKPVQVRDAHYVFINQERTEAFMEIVFYNPNTTLAWFSISIHQYKDKASEAYLSEVYLYETDRNGAWVFVEDISKTKDSLESVLNRYDLFLRS